MRIVGEGQATRTGDGSTTYFYTHCSMTPGQLSECHSSALVHTLTSEPPSVVRSFHRLDLICGARSYPRIGSTPHQDLGSGGPLQGEPGAGSVRAGRPRAQICSETPFAAMLERVFSLPLAAHLGSGGPPQGEAGAGSVHAGRPHAQVCSDGLRRRVGSSIADKHVWPSGLF